MSARWTLLVLVVGALLALPPSVWAQGADTPAAAPAAQANAAANATPAAPAGDESRAETPSDEAQTKISSIRKNEYFYQSYGRRDLCAALVTGEFEPISNPEIVDINTAVVVGIVWGATDRFALVEDGQGNGFILRVGDKVRNGRVVAVHENSLVAQVTLYGMTSRVVLRLENREGKR
jgi:biotin carboxyl carrier protein